MSSRRGQVAPFRVMGVLDAALRRRAEGLPVYDLSAGQPASAAPGAVLAAAERALRRDRLGYTAAAGLAPLRAAIAEHYRRRYGLAVDAGSVIVTTGSSGAILLALLAAFDAGARVAVTRPGYPAYRNMLSALDCRPVEVACGPDTGFALTVAALDAVEGPLDGLVLASPANPTGTALEADQLCAILDWCGQRGVRVISDEIYHGVRYEGADMSAWEQDRSSVVLGSFSKYFAMTGWRLGWLLAPDDLIDSVERLATNVALCAPALSQHAALGAFEDYAELDGHVRRYRHNRDLLAAGLRSAGITTIAPAAGAFYLYADVSAWTTDSVELAARLLLDTGVAVAPGIDFDEVDGGRFIRLSFAGDEVAAAVPVLVEWFAGQPQSQPDAGRQD